MSTIMPSNDPLSWDEVRAAITQLRKDYAGEPGAELLGFVDQILDVHNPRCSCCTGACERSPSTSAVVLPLRRKPQRT